MGHAFLAQSLGRRFEHNPHRCRHRSEHCQFFRIHATGIDVRQNPGLFEDPFSDHSHVFERGFTTELHQRFSRRFIAQFRFLSEREQRFFTTHRLRFADDLDNVVDRHVGRRNFLWCARKGTVVADISTQVRQWYKHFSRVGDHISKAPIAHLGGESHQLCGIVTIR